jgi:uncharacterized membrane protein YgcG
MTGMMLSCWYSSRWCRKWPWNTLPRRQRPVQRNARPLLLTLEERFSPTPISSLAAFGFPSFLDNDSLDRDLLPTFGETRPLNDGRTDLTPSEQIALVPPTSSETNSGAATNTPPLGQPSATSSPPAEQNLAALDSLFGQAAGAQTPPPAGGGIPALNAQAGGGASSGGSASGGSATSGGSGASLGSGASNPFTNASPNRGGNPFAPGAPVPHAPSTGATKPQSGTGHATPLDTAVRD